MANIAGQPQGDARVVLSLGFGGPRTAGQRTVAEGKCQHMGVSSSQECHTAQLLVQRPSEMLSHVTGMVALPFRHLSLIPSWNQSSARHSRGSPAFL